ncbi:MAG TPA: GNAT family N-acetyltransferase, partial [Ramlibacter sp.]|nr:GNAT family N-acetyltransferase [Ramlibacter sp.]
MSEGIVAADGHGPEWAAGVADLVDRAQAAFARANVRGCFTVLDLEPWRMVDAWWLRRRLEPLARLSGRPIRYVPCQGPAPLPSARHETTYAAAWSVGAAPVELFWPAASGAPSSTNNEQPWTPDGAVLVLAGDLAKRLPQSLLLAHAGQIHEWRGAGSAAKWHPVDMARYGGWMAEGVRSYAEGLPSSMLSLPVGYWRFLMQAFAWASHGCMVLSRAEGWSSLAQIREDSSRRADIRCESPPVNFHWLARHASRINAAAHMVHDCRDDSVQLIATGLPNAESTMPTMCSRLAVSMRSGRTHRAQAVLALANAGEVDAAVAVLQQSHDDPALLRVAGDALARAAASASPASRTRLGEWIERVMMDNPWLSDDAPLLREVGRVSLACGRVDLAQTALHALDDTMQALAGDVAMLARCHEQLGRLDAAVADSWRALSYNPKLDDARAVLDRVTPRLAAMSAPWRVQHSSSESPLMLDPLHADHAPLLLRQMRDPSIPGMTVLPPLAEGDDGRGWIQARIDEGIAAYALVHRSHGFVGYLDLRVWKSTAFVCYWIGADYQGMGFCGPAVALACEFALRNGIDLLLSAAYGDNVRSLRVLRKCGFDPMDVRAMPPDGDRIFVMRPAAPMREEQARQRLIDFCANTGSDL